MFCLVLSFILGCYRSLNHYQYYSLGFLIVIHNYARKEPKTPFCSFGPYSQFLVGFLKGCLKRISGFEGFAVRGFYGLVLGEDRWAAKFDRSERPDAACGVGV